MWPTGARGHKRSNGSRLLVNKRQLRTNTSSVIRVQQVVLVIIVVLHAGWGRKRASRFARSCSRQNTINTIWFIHPSWIYSSRPAVKSNAGGS